MDLPHEEKQPVEWRRLHVGAERGVNCEHMPCSQRNWEWQEDRRIDLEPGMYRYNKAFMASLCVETAFGVTKPSVVSKILTLTGVHGHLTALLAEMQDVWRSACFENSETEFRYSRCIRQGGGSSGVMGTCGQVCVVEG